MAKITEHIQNAKGETLFSFEILPPLKGESIDLLVNDILIGKGEVVVINDNFGLRITEIASAEDRLKKL